MKTDLATYLLKEVEYYKNAYLKSQEELAKERETKVEKSGLSGLDAEGISRLLENPLVQTLAGPLLEKMMNGSSNLTGGNQQDERIIQILNYWQQLPEENRQLIYEFMDQLAKQTPEENLMRLKFIVGSGKEAGPRIMVPDIN